MIEDFKFYRLPRCRSQRTRVVKKQIGSAIESYLMREETGVRHTDALDFEITVPTFTGWQTATYVKGDNNSIWYTVEDARENTRFAGQITFSLSFDPFLTLTQGTAPNVKAYWRKLPWASTSAKRGTVLDDSNLIEVSKYPLDVMTWVHHQGASLVTDMLFWVEITTSCTLLGSMDPDTKKFTTVDNITALEKSVQNNSKLFKYGFFALYDHGKHVPRIRMCYNKFHNYKLDEWWKNGGTLEQHEINDYDLFYPSLDDVINDPDEVLGIPADAVLDVSVTAWCPYRYTIDTNTETGHDTEYPVLDDEDQNNLYPYIIRNANIEVLEPDYGKFNPTPHHIAFYELGSVNEAHYQRDEWDAHSISISNDVYVCGEVNLRDANGNVIANIPRDYFVYNSQDNSWVLDYKAQTYSDSTGLYTRVDIGQDEPHIITFPEGKLPFIADTWAQYRIRDMSYDREALQFAKNMAWVDYGFNVAESAIDTGKALISGDLKGAVQNVGSPIMGAIKTAVGNYAKDFEQDLVERRQKGAPGTGFNTGYGISYCDNAYDIGAGFVVMMPSRFDADEAHAQGEYYGYEAGYVGSVSIVDQGGYYEGAPQILTGSFQMPDYYYNRFAEMLINGVRIQVI